jgi:hypothetical protein
VTATRRLAAVLVSDCTEVGYRQKLQRQHGSGVVARHPSEPLDLAMSRIRARTRLKSYVQALLFRIAGTIPVRPAEKCSGTALSDRE